MSYFWYLAFLEGSPNRKSGIIAGARARVVLAALLRSGWNEFELGLDKAAEEVGMAKTYFRKGVDDLVELEWLKKLPSVCGGQGSRYSVADVFLGEGPKKVAPWQESVAAKALWGAGDTKAPGHESILLAVLALSSNEYGFVSTLSHSVIADHSGMETSTLIVMLKRLREKKLIEVFKGGSGKKIQGRGWKLTSVYQLNLSALNCPHQSVELYVDPVYVDCIKAGKLGAWLQRLIKSRYLSNDLGGVLGCLKKQLPDLLSVDLLENLYARSLSAASFLLSNERFKEGVDRWSRKNFGLSSSTDVATQDHCLDIVTRDHSLDVAIQGNGRDIFRELIQSSLSGMQFQNGASGSDWYAYIERVRSAVHTKRSESPLLLLSFVISTAAIYIAMDRRVVTTWNMDLKGEKEVEAKNTGGTYAVHCYREAGDSQFYRLDTK